MPRSPRLLLGLLTSFFLLAAPALAEDHTARPAIDTTLKTEMRELKTKIDADRKILKAEREKMKPIAARLKVNNQKMRVLREKAKAQRAASLGRVDKKMPLTVTPQENPTE